MKIALLNSNPVVGKLVTLSAKKTSDELSRFESIEVIEAGEYDLLLIDDALYSDDLLELVRSKMNFSKVGLIASRNFAADSSEFDFTMNKPFLPTDMVDILSNISSSEESIPEDEEDLSFDSAHDDMETLSEGGDDLDFGGLDDIDSNSELELDDSGLDLTDDSGIGDLELGDSGLEFEDDLDLDSSDELSDEMDLSLDDSLLDDELGDSEDDLGDADELLDSADDEAFDLVDDDALSEIASEADDLSSSGEPEEDETAHKDESSLEVEEDILDLDELMDEDISDDEAKNDDIGSVDDLLADVSLDEIDDAISGLEDDSELEGDETVEEVKDILDTMDEEDAGVKELEVSTLDEELEGGVLDEVQVNEVKELLGDDEAIEEPSDELAEEDLESVLDEDMEDALADVDDSDLLDITDGEEFNFEELPDEGEDENDDVLDGDNALLVDDEPELVTDELSKSNIDDDISGMLDEDDSLSSAEDLLNEIADEIEENEFDGEIADSQTEAESEAVEVALNENIDDFDGISQTDMLVALGESADVEDIDENEEVEEDIIENKIDIIDEETTVSVDESTEVLRQILDKFENKEFRKSLDGMEMTIKISFNESK